MHEFFLQIAWGFGAGVGFSVAFTLSRVIAQFVYGVSARGDDEDEEQC